MTEAVEHKAEQAQETEKTRPGDNLAMKARFDRYNTPFLQLIAPLLTTRYVWLAAEDINPGNLLMKPNPELKPDFKPWVKPDAAGYMRRNFAALSIGGMALGAIAFYSKRTYEDIKTLYSEAVGYELNKKPEDVGWRDLFLKSKNEALGVTRDAYLKRTTARVAAGASFLLPWHVLRDHPHAAPKYDANANAGVGAMGAYFSWEGFIRTPSFFDMEQRMVDLSINRSVTSTQEPIKPKHIQTLMLLQRKHLDKKYEWPELSSPAGLNQAAVAERVADLMNQTYNNTMKKEPANFTIGKFNYLVGFGLLGEFPESLAFIELANKSADMKEVKEAAAAIKEGGNPQEIFQQFGIDMNGLATRAASPAPSPSEPLTTKFVDKAPLAKDKMPLAARTPQDFAAQVGGPRQMSQ